MVYQVNESSHFCGVAEMVGPVDYQNDMDFWCMDKWTGSFPVKWHIIKNVHNSTFRSILLQNNEDKPVTFSRDTQEASCLLYFTKFSLSWMIYGFFYTPLLSSLVL